MSPASIKASSLFSEAQMADCTKVKFEMPIGTWGHTQVEVEYPWQRNLDSIILPLLETAYEHQAEKQRKNRPDGPSGQKSQSRKSRTVVKADQTDSTLPTKHDRDIKLFLKGVESAKDMVVKRGETFQNVLELYAQQTETDVERLELFYKGKHAGRSMTPETGSKTAPSCKSTPSSVSSRTSTPSREDRRLGRQRAGPDAAEPERGSILVANDTGIEQSPYEAPVVPERNPMRKSQHRPESWASTGSSSSAKAYKLLGIEANESQHLLAQISSLIPYQHFSSGAVTQVDLHPGPSRLARQCSRKFSVASVEACEVSPVPEEDVEAIEPLPPADDDDATSIYDLPSPLEHRPKICSHERLVSLNSSIKARRLLGVDRPDSYPGPGRRPASSSVIPANAHTSCPPPATTSHRSHDYPTSTTSRAHPDSLPCCKRLLPPPRDPGRSLRRRSAVETSVAIPDYRQPSDLLGVPREGSSDAPNSQHPPRTKRHSALAVPFADPVDHSPSDPADDDPGDEVDGVHITTTCTGPQPRTNRARLSVPTHSLLALLAEMVDDDGDHGGGGALAAAPDHAIQYNLRGKPIRRCPKMCGIVESYDEDVVPIMRRPRRRRGST